MGFIKKLTVTVADETFDLGLLRRWDNLDANWSDRMIIVHMLRNFAEDLAELDSSKEVHDQYRREEEEWEGGSNVD